MRYRNYYRCPNDGTEWTGEWSCQCNDRCPTCRAEIEPHDSEDIEEVTDDPDEFPSLDEI